MRQRHLSEEQKSNTTEGYAPLLSQMIQTEETPDTTVPVQKADSIEDLAGQLSQEVKAHHKASLQGFIGWLAFCGVLTLLLGYAAKYLDNAWVSSTGIWIFLILFCGATAGLIHSSLKPRKRRREMAASLAKQEDVRSIGTLIDILGLEDGRMHDIAMDALIRLLPRLKASDASLLNATRRAKLNLVLSLPFGKPLFNSVGYVFRRADIRDVDFRVAILKALEQVGDASALPIVTRLANGKAQTEGQRHIQEAARECLPALERFVQQEGARQTLLRATEAPDMAAETLLRAAAGTTPTASDQLLRPSER